MEGIERTLNMGRHADSKMVVSAGAYLNGLHLANNKSLETIRSLGAFVLSTKLEFLDVHSSLNVVLDASRKITLRTGDSNAWLNCDKGAMVLSLADRQNIFLVDDKPVIVGLQSDNNNSRIVGLDSHFEKRAIFAVTRSGPETVRIDALNGVRVIVAVNPKHTSFIDGTDMTVIADKNAKELLKISPKHDIQTEDTMALQSGKANHHLYRLRLNMDGTVPEGNAAPDKGEYYELWAEFGKNDTLKEYDGVPGKTNVLHFYPSDIREIYAMTIKRFNEGKTA